jgi:hypothetical protein
MAAWAPVAGATLLIPSGPAGNHLFVVLNDPIPLDTYPGESCVLVCSCSIPTNVFYDPTCALDTGCHPFISHPSYVAYRHTRIERATDLIQRVENNVFIPHELVSAPLLQRMKDGLDASRFTPRAFKGLPI